MDKLHVLITVPLKEAEVKRIAAVSPRVEVVLAVEEVRAELGIPVEAVPMGRSRQQAISPEEASRALDRMLAHTEVIFGWRLPKNLLSRAPHLKWVQGFGVGVDLLAGSTGLLQSDILVTNARGIHAHLIAEFVLCFILMIVKRMPHFVTNKERRRWEPVLVSELVGKTVGIIGMGEIGSEVAMLSRAFRMRTLGLRRSATSRKKDVDGVDELFPPNELLRMLPECDFVVLAVPLTPETKGLIGEAELKAMKPTAHIINVARGPVIRQDILIQALKEGWIAGAALDVFETEPLPPESELWALPNVIISPHNAGHWDRYPAVVTDFFCENLKRFLAGDELINIIDKSRGY